MLTTLPQFHGFYESCHDQQLDMALENIMGDSSGCSPISDKLSNDVHIHLNWQHVFEAYAARYAEDFCDKLKAHCGVEMTYKDMQSPKEYNFTTDRLFCEIDGVNLVKLEQWVSKHCKAEFLEVCKESFTSRSGFISSYSPDYDDWPDLLDWDHNQIGALIQTVANHMARGDEWDTDDELALVEDYSGSGLLDNWIFGKGQSSEAIRIMNIACYLRRREERQYG